MARPLSRLANHIGVALCWRYLCHSIMLLLAMLNEPRPAPTMPDTVLSLLPRQDWIDLYNYHIWLVCYVPVALWLWRRDRDAFVHFLYVGGVLSLLRGVCIGMTGLGPVHLDDINAGISYGEALEAWWVLVNPFSTLMGEAAHLYLTKDLFFSGHTATTFLLWLYCRRHEGLGRVALVAHVVVVSTVFLSHLHYTIDVIGAWSITYILFKQAQKIRWPRRPIKASE